MTSFLKARGRVRSEREAKVEDIVVVRVVDHGNGGGGDQVSITFAWQRTWAILRSAVAGLSHTSETDAFSLHSPTVHTIFIPLHAAWRTLLRARLIEGLRHHLASKFSLVDMMSNADYVYTHYTLRLYHSASVLIQHTTQSRRNYEVIARYP